MLRIEAEYCSAPGSRTNNEDRAEISAGGRVCAVADGMGGERGGEVASQLAVDQVRRAVPELCGAAGEAPVYQSLRDLFQQVNRAILEEGRHHPELESMGTTLTLALLDGEALYFGHAGDSRLYLWRAGQCQVLSEDHTQAQAMARDGWLSETDALRSRFRHVLTRWLGSVRGVEPQCGHSAVRSGDRLLLCSDGLHDVVEAGAIQDVLGGAGAAGEMARQLVDLALHSGRPNLDNITALVVHLEAEGE